MAKIIRKAAIIVVILFNWLCKTDKKLFLTFAQEFNQKQILFETTVYSQQANPLQLKLYSMLALHPRTL